MAFSLLKLGVERAAVGATVHIILRVHQTIRAAAPLYEAMVCGALTDVTIGYDFRCRTPAGGTLHALTATGTKADAPFSGDAFVLVGVRRRVAGLPAAALHATIGAGGAAAAPGAGGEGGLPPLNDLLDSELAKMTMRVQNVATEALALRQAGEQAADRIATLADAVDLARDRAPAADKPFIHSPRPIDFPDSTCAHANVILNGVCVSATREGEGVLGQMLADAMLDAFRDALGDERAAAAAAAYAEHGGVFARQLARLLSHHHGTVVTETHVKTAAALLGERAHLFAAHPAVADQVRSAIEARMLDARQTELAEQRDTLARWTAANPPDEEEAITACIEAFGPRARDRHPRVARTRRRARPPTTPSAGRRPLEGGTTGTWGASAPGSKPGGGDQRRASI